MRLSPSRPPVECQFFSVATFVLGLFNFFASGSVAAQTNAGSSIRAPQSTTQERYKFFTVVAPSLSWTTGTLELPRAFHRNASGPAQSRVG
jgi:hypothetical protein